MTVGSHSHKECLRHRYCCNRGRGQHYVSQLQSTCFFIQMARFSFQGRAWRSAAKSATFQWGCPGYRQLCMHIYMYMHEWCPGYRQLCMHIYMYMHEYACIYACIFMHMCMYMHAYMHVNACINACI